VAGVDMRWNNSFHHQGWYELTKDPIPLPTRVWTPLTDHNQMALVKAGLRDQKIEYLSEWDDWDQLHEVRLYRFSKPDDNQVYMAAHPDELRAFALAVAKMKEDNAC